MAEYSFEKLTFKQKQKWRHFLEAYPQFATVPAMKDNFTSAELGKALLSRSNDVVRDLKLISKRISCALRVQLMKRVRSGDFIPADHDDIRHIKRRDKEKDNKGWFKKNRFEGTSQWIKLSLE